MNDETKEEYQERMALQHEWEQNPEPDLPEPSQHVRIEYHKGNFYMFDERRPAATVIRYDGWVWGVGQDRR